jgi:outer membrane protein assembly factor BamB
MGPDMNRVHSSSGRTLRLWPGIVAAVALLLFRLVAPWVMPDSAGLGVPVTLAALVVILLWWLFFSRAPWIERIGAVVLMAAATIATGFIVHPSVAGGMMGWMLPIIAIPLTLGPAFVAWAVLTRGQADRVRRTTMAMTIFFACGVWALARTDGVMGGAGSQWAWRWTPTAEERLLAVAPALPTVAAAPVEATAETPAPLPAAAAGAEHGAVPAVTPAASVPDPVTRPAAPEWAGFRGAARDDVISASRIATDWTASPPVEIWRRPIGPGWSSFAVQGDLVYTQEQRGEDEMVSAYRLSTGVPVWTHRDPVRFYESNGGAGPRATPTVQSGRVYSVGATGIVNALDARTGRKVWSRNAETDTGAPRPGWGFAGSPLVVDDMVIVAASGRLVAYDLATGEPRWTRTTGGGGYSSPHLATIDGVSQVLMPSGGGLTSVAPADGSVLWEIREADATSILQPVVVGARDVLFAGGDMMGGTGIRRVAASRSEGTWRVEPRWSSRGLKPYFSDFVVHEGHAFGFDGTILSCIDIDSGERRWKGGRYGAGQMLLLTDQDLLLVLSEEGELALVSATPEAHREVARFKVIEGKTWNHPVLVGNVLLVRNGEEMAAFSLTVRAPSRR